MNSLNLAYRAIFVLLAVLSLIYTIGFSQIAQNLNNLPDYLIEAHGLNQVAGLRSQAIYYAIIGAIFTIVSVVNLIVLGSFSPFVIVSFLNVIILAFNNYINRISCFVHNKLTEKYSEIISNISSSANVLTLSSLLIIPILLLTGLVMEPPHSDPFHLFSSELTGSSSSRKQEMVYGQLPPERY